MTPREIAALLQTQFGDKSRPASWMTSTRAFMWMRPIGAVSAMSPDFSSPSLCPPHILGSRREEGATGEGPIFEFLANTPFIPTIRPGGVRRELALVDPHGVRWLANKP
jgi:hypothetical protein